MVVFTMNVEQLIEELDGLNGEIEVLVIVDKKKYKVTDVNYTGKENEIFLEVAKVEK